MKLLKQFFTPKVMSLLFVQIILRIVTMLFTVIMPTYIIDMLLISTNISDFLSRVWLFLIIELLIAVSYTIISIYSENTANIARTNNIGYVSKWIMGLEYKYLFDPKSLDKINLIYFYLTDGPHGLTTAHSLLLAITNGITSIIILIIYMLIIGQNSLILIPTFITYIILSGCISSYFKMKLNKIQNSEQISLRKITYLTNLLFIYKQREDIILNEQQEIIQVEYNNTVDERLKYRKQTLAIQIISNIANSIIKYGTIALMLSQMIVNSNTQIIIGTLWLVYNIIINAVNLSENIVEAVTRYRQDLSKVHIYEEVKKINSSNFVEIENNFAIEKIEFINVYFSYANKRVLSGCTFCLEKGSTYALVGENGSGKTTIINLLMGFFEVDSGQILINGINIDKYPKNKLRNMFSTVFQDVNLYPFSLAENIKLDTREFKSELISKYKEEISFLDKYKNPTDVQLTSLLVDDGIELSGGECQQLAITRSIYNKRQVAIFDEPTSNLDPVAELKYYSMFSNLFSDCISLMITHRMGGCRIVDQILFISNGKISEQGTHHELIELNKEYSKFYNAQAYHFQGGTPNE